ncbi:hypothetical protein D3C85_1848890 [compost metagenome]
MRTVPEVGSISRLIIFSVVVLPQPEGPRKTQISPLGTVIETASTARTSVPSFWWKDLVSWSSSIMVGGFLSA